VTGHGLFAGGGTTPDRRLDLYQELVSPLRNSPHLSAAQPHLGGVTGPAEYARTRLGRAPCRRTSGSAVTRNEFRRGTRGTDQHGPEQDRVRRGPPFHRTGWKWWQTCCPDTSCTRLAGSPRCCFTAPMTTRCGTWSRSSSG